MVGVQDEDTVHCLGQYRADLLLFTWGIEHHVQEVFGVAQVIARVHHGLPHGVLVDHGGQGRHLGDQTNCGNFAMMRIVDIQ